MELIQLKTSRPISTISFNTDPFLVMRLNDMLNAKVIVFWTAILHKPEDDEAGKKFHYHVLVVPGERPIEVQTFRENFIEPDPENEKPRDTLIWRISDIDNALLYFKHDKDYLAYKGQSRKYHYTWEEFYTSDENQLLYYIKSINLDLNPYKQMREYAEAGMTFSEYAQNGKVHLQQYIQTKRAWDDIILNLKEELKRGNGETHE